MHQGELAAVEFDEDLDQGTLRHFAMMRTARPAITCSGAISKLKLAGAGIAHVDSVGVVNVSSHHGSGSLGGNAARRLASGFTFVWPSVRGRRPSRLDWRGALLAGSARTPDRDGAGARTGHGLRSPRSPPMWRARSTMAGRRTRTTSRRATTRRRASGRCISAARESSTRSTGLASAASSSSDATTFPYLERSLGAPPDFPDDDAERSLWRGRRESGWCSSGSRPRRQISNGCQS